MSDRFLKLIEHTEKELAEFYNFDIVSNAAIHLIDAAELKNFGSKQSQRAQLVVTETEDELFVGLNFHDDIKSVIDEQSPLENLTIDNLDAYCVVVEEISHFHFLLNRASVDQNISKLELECQGEIDKLLLCAIRLKEQQNDPHYLPLARKLFDEAIVYLKSQEELYDQANRIAARFWFDLFSYTDGIEDPKQSPTLKSILNEIYRSPWQARLQNMRIPKAA